MRAIPIAGTFGPRPRMVHAFGERRGRVQAALAALVAAAATLAGCGSPPPRVPAATPAAAVAPVTPRAGPAPSLERDGPQAHPPAGLERVPDAEPQVEAVRRAGPNRPYEMLGRDYVPITDERAYTEHGLASWYGRNFHGRRTASGETYDMYAMTAAHPTLPIPSYVRVRNPANRREVVVRINDRGPFHAGRIIDLSYTAALKLGVLAGVRRVEVTRITPEDIRTGRWRKGATPEPGERARTEVATREAPPPGEAGADPIADLADR